MAKKQKAVWITGASSGIGKSAVREFARTGSRVFASARRVTELERLKRELAKEKIRIDIIPCNIASHVNVDQVVKKISADYHITCILNNAGITSFKSAEDNSVQEISDIINTNLLGAVYAIKYVLPQMIEQQEGTIINVLSSAVKKIFTQSTAYTASKVGLLGYTNVLREEIRQHNIRVINIIPGATDTPMWSSAIRKENAEKMMSPDEVARIIVWNYLQKGNAVNEEIIIKPITGDL
jgi:3-oxoacyl-[acyl-carrier protein] reductase